MGDRPDLVLGLVRVIVMSDEQVMLVVQRISEPTEGVAEGEDEAGTVVGHAVTQGCEVPVVAFTELGDGGSFTDVRVSNVASMGGTLVCRSEVRSPMIRRQLTTIHEEWIRSLELRASAD